MKLVLGGVAPSQIHLLQTWGLLAKSDGKARYSLNFQGLSIGIENPKGTYRHWHWHDPLKNEDGKTLMKYPYGYIKLTKNTDGDSVDCYIGPNKKSTRVFVVKQQNPKTSEYDEDKVMLGFDSAADAKKAYLVHYDDPKFFGGMEEWDLSNFRAHVKQKKHFPKGIKADRETRLG